MSNYVTTNLKGISFTVPAYYKVTKVLGQGAYGVVVEAMDVRTNTHVAIKKLEKVFAHLVDAKRVLRELSLLRFLRHENVAAMTDIVVPPNPSNLDEMYVVFTFMQTDMYKIISSQQALTPDHQQFFMYQLFRALAYIHSAGVVHRDLKPSNLLLNADCALQICDFGLARLSSEMCTIETKMTEYVSTRWYRAPEVILGDPKYGQAIDIFSCGCIFAELVLRKPLFPGRDYINQLHLIMDVLGTPSSEVLDRIDNDSARQYVKQQPAQTPIDLKTKFPTLSADGIDLLGRCLQLDSKMRPTAEECMKHKYFDGIWDESDLLLYKEKPIKLFFESHELSRELLELGFLNEVRKFHPEMKEEVEKRAAKLRIDLKELE